MKELKEIKKYTLDIRKGDKVIKELSLEEKIYWYIKGKEFVTFIELGHFLGDEMKGDRYLAFRGSNGIDLNCWAWDGMNQKFINTIEEMVAKGYIYINGSTFLVYLFDGGGLRLPIGKKVPKKGYKEPHWIPVVFTTFKQSHTFKLDNQKKVLKK